MTSVSKVVSQPAATTPQPSPCKAPVDDKVKKVAIAKLAEQSELEKDLIKEIEVNLRAVQKEEGKLFDFTRIDVTREKSLISSLAVKLVDVLRKVFDQILSSKNSCPMSAEDEVVFANVASRLSSAYVLSGASDKADKLAQQAADAMDRAETKTMKIVVRESLLQTIDELEAWANEERNDSVRAWPVLNQFLWTTDFARLKIAKMKVEIAEQLVRDVLPYPKLLGPELIKLIEAKENRMKIQIPDSIEYLASKREIREHKEELQKINKLV